jgi:sensor histidine kinase YesM
VSKDTDSPNWIRIRLQWQDNQLDFSISNSISRDQRSTKFTDVVQYGGIGLKNVQRRLDLIYPGQYHLDIRREDTRFDIRLRLELTELMVPLPAIRTA